MDMFRPIFRVNKSQTRVIRDFVLTEVYTVNIPLYHQFRFVFPSWLALAICGFSGNTIVKGVGF